MLGALVVLACQASAHADTVNVAVASNFTGAMKRLSPLFEARTGHRMAASFGATGQLYAQINHGAPFDVFLSADDSTAQKLVAEGKAGDGSYFVYARGRLAVWSATAELVDAQGEVLREARFDKLAIANPKTAPYGRAAVETLRQLDLLDTWQPKFVTGENINQAWQFIASGNVPLGFVALSQVMALPPEERGSFWLVPADFHEPLDQAAVLLTGARSPSAAAAFLDFLRSPEAVAIIRQLGYEIPAPAP